MCKSCISRFDFRLIIMQCDVAEMSLALRTNRWASRIIIILQLVTWYAVGIVLLQRGVSTLQREMLERETIIEVIKKNL